ncbi:MAG: homoserine dehydrogenase, partial [Lachnospiraceae bacterium]
MENVQIALLGLGTVGTGVYKVLKAQKEEISHKVGTEIQLKKILVRNTKKAAEKLDDPSVLTTEWKSILEDPEISVVVEVMGGIEPARSYILDALHAGKSVVTANKDLLASHGKELMDAAAEAKADLLFEASVAGGI